MGFQKKQVETISFKKSRFDFSHDVTSSFEFGECQPILCRLCATEHEKHNINIGSIVRLMPLQFPTFGRVMQRITTHFVPFSHLFRNWKNFLSDIPTQKVSISGGNYSELTTIPYGFPSVQTNTLMKILLRNDYSTYRVVGRPGTNDTTAAWDNLNSSQITDSVICSFFRNGGSSSKYIGVANMTDFYSEASNINSEVVNLLPDSSDFQSFCHHDGLNCDLMLLVKLRSKGRRLLKVLYGLGYKPSFSSEISCNLLPLLAYFKSWFDTYSINNYDNWESSSAYKLIKFIEDHGTYPFSDIDDDDTGVSLLLDFFLDLSECWFSEDADYVSSALPVDGYLPSVTNKEVDGLFYQKTMANGYQSVNAGDTVDGYPSMENGAYIETYDSNNPNVSKRLDHLSIQILKRLYISSLRDSATGYALEQRLKQRGYGSFVEGVKKYFLGSRTQMVQISDVTSTTENQDAPLGLVAGKGVGVIEKETISFDNDEPGYIISICVIYPICKVVNSLDPTLLGISKYSFYNPEYDALGFETTPYASIGHFVGTEHGQNAGVASDRQSFGLHPRYTGFKCAPSNILNGNFSTRSTMMPLLPYTLDRVIFENLMYQFDRSGTNQNPTFKTQDSGVQSLMPSAGKRWRFVADSRWKGNYNRIFYGAVSIQNPYDSTDIINDVIPQNDNFMANFEIVHTAYASMKPIEESWNAESEEVMKNRSSDSVKQ